LTYSVGLKIASFETLELFRKADYGFSDMNGQRNHPSSSEHLMKRTLKLANAMA
jgi:hypothetical protein